MRADLFARVSVDLVYDQVFFYHSLLFLLFLALMIVARFTLKLIFCYFYSANLAQNQKKKLTFFSTRIRNSRVGGGRRGIFDDQLSQPFGTESGEAAKIFGCSFAATTATGAATQRAVHRRTLAQMLRLLRFGHRFGELLSRACSLAQSAFGLHVDAHIDKRHDYERHEERARR